MTEENFGKFNVRKECLANGLRVVTASYTGAQSVALRIVTKTGSAFEEPSQQGIAHFVEHMLFQGTERFRSFNDIGRTIESLGGIINGGTDRFKTTYWVKVLSEHCDQAFDLLSDLIVRSRFDPQDIERERSVISEEIHRRHDRPDELVGSLLLKALWPDQPLGRETLGRIETISVLSRDDLLSYLRRQYVASDIVVSAAGAVRHEDIVALAERYLSGLPTGHSKPLPSGSFAPRRAIVVNRRSTAQVQFAIGFPAFGRDDPRIYAARLLAAVLGRGIGSRLFLAVRQRLGLAYSIGAGLQDLIKTGAFDIGAGIKSAGLRDAVDAILREVAMLRAEAPGEEDVNRAKEMDKSRFLFMMESDDAIADRLGTQELLLGRTIPMEEEIAGYDAVTADEIRAVAQELFDLDRIKIAAIGEVSEEELERAFVG
ncbi:MAG: insulinase family protein [Chloroflexota bacterium]|nr:MAG: insulinase family protein [Chloroflexota bacterium]